MKTILLKESELVRLIKRAIKEHTSNNHQPHVGPRWICQQWINDTCNCRSVVQPCILPDSFNTKKECEMDQSNCCGKRRKKPYSMPVNPIQDL